MKRLKEFIARDTPKVRQRIFLAGFCTSIALLLAGISVHFLWILGLVGFIVSVGYVFLAFRCPHCDAYLGARMVGFAHCPNCGKELE